MLASKSEVVEDAQRIRPAGSEVDYLRVFIKNLRKKIELNPDDPQYIKTEPWVGYRFNGTPESS